MGIEQNKQGAYLPDKNTPWPKMTTEERSKVYGSLKETYGGHVAQLDSKTELAKKKLEAKVKAALGRDIDDFWDQLRGLDLMNEFKAEDPKLKGMPVSMTLLLTFQEKMPTGIGIKAQELMLFCLNYLQNAPENKTKNPHGNIDLVPKNGSVKIVANENEDRWILRIEDATKKQLFEGYLFPPDL